MKNNKKIVLVGIVLVILIVIGIFLFTNKEKVTVAFDETDINDVKLTKGKYIEKPDDPIKDGYKFLGWYVDGKLFDFSKPVEDDVKLEAKWEKIKSDSDIFTITFNTDGGSKIGNQSVKINEKVVKPSIPTKKGYTFVSWQLDGINYDFNKKVTSDIILKATWKSPKSFVVTFDANGGNVKTTSKLIENKGKYGDLPLPTKDGSKFDGWYTEKTNGTKVTSNTIVTLTETHTIYAHWTEKKYVYIVNAVDSVSPQSNVVFYEDNKAISITTVYNSKGDKITAAINDTTATMDTIKITNPLKIKLSDGTIVTANKK